MHATNKSVINPLSLIHQLKQFPQKFSNSPHVLRSVCNLQVHYCMCRSCFACYTSCWAAGFSTKTLVYQYFLLFPVILRSGYTRQYDFLPDFVLRFDCTPSRASIPTRSYHYMRTKWPCTEITSRNANWLQRIGTKIAISRLLESFVMSTRINLLRST